MSGKSFTAREISKVYGKKLIDIDKTIEVNQNNSIENIFKQQIEVDSSVGINVSTTAGTKNLSYQKIAFKFTSAEKQDIKSFKLKLAKTALWLNEQAYIQCSIYDNYNNLIFSGYL